MKLRKNKNSLRKTKETHALEEAAINVGSLVVKEGAVHAENDGRTVVDDMDLLLVDLAEKGYDKASSGRGPWVGEKGARVISELAIKHPEGQVVAVSTYKFYTGHGANMRSYPYIEEMTPDAYQDHVAEWQITTSPDQPLADFIVPGQTEA